MVVRTRNNTDSCDLYFKNISSYVRNEKKKILHDLSGKFLGGNLIGVLGPSGSGKTTLLNTLSGYKYQNATVDTLRVNGVDTDFAHLQNISCYITQDIHLNDTLTVMENMHFAAEFKLGQAHSSQEKLTIIDGILDCFGLISTKETRTGKLSSGERKRLAIALEMIDDPKMIYLDEPTTGLDITTTQQILFCLKKLTESGKTAICSIHQVCATHFELFDLVYVIGDGQCAYQGKPKEMVGFLDQHGLPCNIYHNPADYIIELCCGDFGADKTPFLIKASENSEHFIKVLQTETLCNNNDINRLSYAQPDWNYKLQTLVNREWVKMRRNVVLTYLRFCGTNLQALFVGFLFYDIGNDASKMLFNYNLVVSVVCNIILTGLLYPIISFPMEMNVLKREVHNKYYTILQYYCTITLLDLPISLLTIISSNLVIYYLTGLILESHRILLFLMFIGILGSVINALGFFFGTLLDLNNAIFFGSISHLSLISISGVGIMIKDLPWLIDNLSRFVHVRNGIEGICVTLFGLNRTKLDCAEEDFCYYNDSNLFLFDNGINADDYSWNAYVLIGWLVIVRIFTYFTMKYKLANL